MKYLVDPQLIVDVLEGEGERSAKAAALFARHRGHGLILAPTSYLALSSAFMGIQSMQDRFLENLGVSVAENAPAEVMSAAYSAWSRYQKENPHERGGMGVFDQLYIGAFALVYDGILTRNGALYRQYFSTLNILEP